MDKLKIVILFLLTSIGINCAPLNLSANNTSKFSQEIYPITECNDGIDNDGDGGIDFGSDLQCLSFYDDSELIDERITPSPSPTPTPIVIITTPTPQPPVIDIVTTPIREVRKLVQRFLWAPLGNVLGIEEGEGIADEQTEKLIDTATAFFLSIGIIISVYYLFLLAIVVLYAKRNKDEQKEFTQI